MNAQDSEDSATRITAPEEAPVDLFQLPPPRALGSNPVADSLAPYRVLTLTIRWLALLFVIFAALMGEADIAPWIPAAVAGAALPHLLLSWLEARRRCWGLREHDLTYTSGLLVRRTTLMPLSRIQHVETLNGPLERAFDLERLVCYTAGGLSADLVLAGLHTDDAGRLREYLLDYVGTRVQKATATGNEGQSGDD